MVSLARPRQTPSNRKRMSCGIGFPVWLVNQYIPKVIRRGYDVALIVQGDNEGRFVRERYIGRVYRSGVLLGFAALNANLQGMAWVGVGVGWVECS